MKEEDSSVSRLRRHEQIRDAYELALRRGENPDLSSFLSKGQDLDRDELFRTLFRVQMDWMQQQDHQPELHEWFHRFPEFASIMKEEAPGASEAFSFNATLSNDDLENAQAADSRTVGSDTSNEKTIDTWGEDGGARGGSSATSLPERYGRYRIERLLGRGSFGQVMLAFDEELERQVALKVPHRERIANERDLEAYVAEARTVASLKHPNLVQVYNIERTDDGLCYVVSEFIDGRDLKAYLRQRRLSHSEASQIVADIADALAYAHERRVYHRDVKPGNILISNEGTAHLADFGLAIKEEDWGRGAKLVGTPNYMSPEQARGEGHRVDGRSDIFSLGVVMYELLTGRIPWRSRKTSELLDEIAETEAPPLQQHVRDIHPELERICLKALSLKLRERYASAEQFADDLRDCLEDFADKLGDSGSTRSTEFASRSGSRSRRGSRGSRRRSGSRSSRSRSEGSRAASATEVGSRQEGKSTVADAERPAQVIPKGLRFFDREDADFFLRLLPGPRDRYGLPDSIRFWIARIENWEASIKCPIGLIYGPSGCGKSSFVRAGVLPDLDASVVPVVVEGTASGLEKKLTREINEKCAGLDARVSLPETIMSIRRGRGLRPGNKLLIVIDQFEQWLNANAQSKPGELHYALRQCDGERVQCILLGRTEYTIGIHRFTTQLDMTIEEGRNAMVVDLFDKIHARNVLKEFGRAYGRIPREDGDIRKEHDEFLSNVIEELADHDKVSPIQIAVFSEMVKGKEWTAKTLWKAGGAHAVGKAFLEDAFESRTAPLAHRIHQEAAQAVLMQLLPAANADIKGGSRGRQELVEASGYSANPDAFEELMGVLDSDLRLITPVDAESSGQRYQLTHDYLVPSLRAWLYQKQRQTKRGRAEVRLEELSSLWNERPRKSHLPSILEYLGISFRTRQANWTANQKKMMRRARRYYATRFGTAALVLLLASVAGYLAWKQNRITTLIADLKSATAAQMTGNIRQLGGVTPRLRSRLRDELKSVGGNSRARMNLLLTLSRSSEVDAGELSGLLLDVARPDEVDDLVSLIGTGKVRQPLTEQLATFLSKSNDPDDVDRRLRATSILLGLDGEQWSEQLADHLTHDLLTAPTGKAEDWVAHGFDEYRFRLMKPLADVLTADTTSSADRQKCCRLLVVAGNEAPQDIARLVSQVKDIRGEMSLLIDGMRDAPNPTELVSEWKRELTTLLEEIRDVRLELNEKNEQLATLQMELNDAGPEVDLEALRKEFKTQRRDSWSLNAHIEVLADRIARVAVAILSFGQVDSVWRMLSHEEPRVVSFLIYSIPQLVRCDRVIDQLDQLPTNDRDPTATAMRQGILQCLTDYVDVRNGFNDAQRRHVADRAARLFLHDEDPGVHGSAELLLRRLGAELPALPDNSAEEVFEKSPERLGWWKSPHGFTMTLVPETGGFPIGSPWSEKEREHTIPGEPEFFELRRKVRIPRSFAISTTEVQMRSFREFVESEQISEFQPNEDIVSAPNCPGHGLSWEQAARFCNWLSKQEGLPSSQQCYVFGLGGVGVRKDHLSLRGYRLPTEAEYEVACRAGTNTARHFGESAKLMERYAWHLQNSGEVSMPVGTRLPNQWGLFDTLGNIAEWCDDPPGGIAMVDANASAMKLVPKGNRPIRGGAFTYGFFQQLRSAAVDRTNRDVADYRIGFRVARTITAAQDSSK